MGKDTLKEFVLESQIIEYLRRLGAVVFKTHDSRHRPAETGVPDIVACLDGVFIAVEVKAEGGRLSRAQEKIMAACREALGTVIIARNLDDVMQRIELMLQTSEKYGKMKE
jgi:Holliday junction resolvase